MERAVAVAEKRAKKVDDEFEQYRRYQRQSPEAALHQEIATLKGMLADSERKIQTERTEKNQAFLEKERFRASIHKLVRDKIVLSSHPMFPLPCSYLAQTYAGKSFETGT
mmetsp:Transcript_14320/g.41984  ORF Transcript_14320/g.41984 Transcript_14320/m.41984 type:complete len:110 (+) Transcript_14320:868-1197(+)